MSKIEDGNIKAAIRIIVSDNRPADDTTQTLQGLRDGYPQAATDGQQVPDPWKFPVVLLSEENVVTAIRFFPAVSCHFSTGGGR